jgi:hypothetical protein
LYYFGLIKKSQEETFECLQVNWNFPEECETICEFQKDGQSELRAKIPKDQIFYGM